MLKKKWIMSPQSFGVKKCVSNHFLYLHVPTTVLEPKWPFPINTRVIWVLGTCWCFWCFLFTSKVPRQEEASTETEPKTSMMQNVPRERRHKGRHGGRNWLRFNDGSNDVKQRSPNQMGDGLEDHQKKCLQKFRMFSEKLQL